MFDVLVQIHGSANHDGLGIIKGLGDFLAFLQALSTKTPAEILVTFMPGIGGMANIHPLLVHFPIVLLILFFFVDTLGGLFSKPAWRQFATPILYIGTLSAVLTLIAGLQAAYSMPHNSTTHAIMLRHQALGISVTVLALLLSLHRVFVSAKFMYTKTYGYFALSGLLVLLLTLGADLGGLMVYQYGVAVTPVTQQHIIDKQSLSDMHQHKKDNH